MLPSARVLLVTQAGLLIATVLLFVSPFALPDPLRLGPQLSWAVVCLGISALICVPELFAGRWPATRLDGLLAAYVVLVGVSAFASVDRGTTLKAAILLASQIGMFYSAAVMTRRAPHVGSQVLLVLIIGAAIVELIAFGYHVELGLGARPTEYPLPAGWSGYPELGVLAALQVGALAGALLAAARPLGGIALALLLLVATAEILFLYSRTAWAAAAVVGLAAVPFAARARKTLLLGGAAIVLVVAGLASLNPTVRFLASNALTGSLASPRADVHAAAPTSRFQLWRKTDRMIADHPLTGVGLGNFRPVFETQYNPDLNNDSRRGVHAHNLFLHETAEVGIPGGLCYAAFWIAALWIAGRTAWRSRRPAAIGVFLAIVAALMANLTDSVPNQTAGTRVFLLIWTILGLAAGMDDRSPGIMAQLQPRERHGLDERHVPVQPGFRA